MIFNLNISWLYLISSFNKWTLLLHFSIFSAFKFIISWLCLIFSFNKWTLFLKFSTSLCFYSIVSLALIILSSFNFNNPDVSTIFCLNSSSFLFFSDSFTNFIQNSCHVEFSLPFFSITFCSYFLYSTSFATTVYFLQFLLSLKVTRYGAA